MDASVIVNMALSEMCCGIPGATNDGLKRPIAMRQRGDGQEIEPI